MGLLLAVLMLASCADGSDKSGQNAAEPASPPSAATSNAPSTAPSAAEDTISIPPGAPKTTKVEPPTDDFQQVVATGKIRVAGTCIELITDQLHWVLIGPPVAQLRDGQQVKVTGVPNPNRETGCNGSPLLVSAVQPG
ncbi:hypothetical protein [Dactylosporangium sp. CS-033363]|uniref:hypothetical protein n=1 Tax=Dactylosporangium sp. CS-033363 TaxID=3239935 RepID=UPI003D8F20C6